MDSLTTIDLSDPEDDGDLSYRSVSPMTPIVSPDGISSDRVSLAKHDHGPQILPTVDEEYVLAPSQGPSMPEGSSTSLLQGPALEECGSPASSRSADGSKSYGWSFWRQVSDTQLPPPTQSDAAGGSIRSVDGRPRSAGPVAVQGGAIRSGKRSGESTSPIASTAGHAPRDPSFSRHRHEGTEVEPVEVHSDTRVAPAHWIHDPSLTAESLGAKVTAIKTDRRVLPNWRYLMKVESIDGESQIKWNWVDWDKHTIPDDIADEFRQVLEEFKANSPAPKSVSVTG